MATPLRARKAPVSNVVESPATTAGRTAGASKRRMQMTDIARMAGVSVSTVSRALSGSPLIPEVTRHRIAELAKSVKYRVNVGAANLRKQNVQTIGVVILSDTKRMISDPFLLSLLGSVADTLDERGMWLLLIRLQANRRHIMSDMVCSGQVDGLIVIGQRTLHDYLNELSRDGFPMVVWGAPLPDALYSVVGGDNAMGGYLATRHLIQQGSRRIAFFGDCSHPEVGLRFQGYQRALQEAGIEQDPRLLQPFLFGDEHLRAAVEIWLESQLSFDAIFAASDVSAISLMGALAERGIRVPRHVRVVGYDDIALADQVRPTLSTIHQPTGEAGRALVDLLFEALAGHPKRNIVLTAELIVRESTG